MRRRSGVHLVDDLDRTLCDLLVANPRRSNRSLAAATGVTDETVAARLKRMLDMNVLAVTVAVNWEGAGFGARAILRLKANGRPPAETAEPWLEMAGIHSAVVAMGAADLVVGVLGTDLRALRETILHITTAPGIGSAVVDVVSETCWHDTLATTLPIAPWSARDFPEPSVELDDLDHRIIEELIVDGQESSREIARRLGSNDGTVRARVKRLEESGLLALSTVVDTVTTGDVTSVASVFISVDPNGEVDLVAHLRKRPEVVLLERCMGGTNLHAFVIGSAATSVDRFVTRNLEVHPAVRRLEVATGVETLRHQSHLVALGARRESLGLAASAGA